MEGPSITAIKQEEQRIWLAFSYNARYNFMGLIPSPKSAELFAMMTVKVTTVGNSVGIVLPKELLKRLHISKGDVLHVADTPKGVELTPFNEEFGQQMDVAEGVMRKRRNVLRKLAE